MNMRFVRTWAMLALVLVVGLSVTGGTIAWFTDSVTSANNVIQAGNLDVELYHTNKKVTDEKVDGTTKLFAIEENTLWEPGVVTYENLTVMNEGNLSLYYDLGINVSDENYVVDGNNQYGLSSALKMAVVEGGVTGTTREEVLAQATDGAPLVTAAHTGTLDPGASEVYGLIVYWEPSADDNHWNVNNGKTVTPYKGTAAEALKIDLGVKLRATQLEAEEDAFDPNYDINAKYYINFNDLQAAINNGGTVGLGKDITLPAGESLVIPEGKSVTLILGDKKLIGVSHKNDGPVIRNEGNLTIQGGVISSTAENGGSAIVNNGTLTVNNATLNGASNADGSWPSYTVNNTGVMTVNNTKITSVHGAVCSYGEGAVVTLNNSEIDMYGIPGFTSHGIYTYSSGSVIVNGGTYTNRATDQASTGASVINGAVTVNAGTFNGRIENYYGTPVIKGGTFSVEPRASFVASGYEVTDNGNGTFTVGGRKVSTAAEFADAIANGEKVELTQDVNLDKIDLTDAITNDVVINANGHKIITTDAYGIEVTPGKNVTISNADVVMTKEGDYITYAAGFKIANGDYAGATITLKDCTITMANTDWAYPVNMPASVKNLNLVIDNCKLEGAIAVQCWGDNNTITITDSELICNYTTNAQYTSYCVVLQDDGTYAAENNTLVIDNCKFTYSGVDNFNSEIHAVSDLGTGNTVTVTNCTYGEKVVAE